MFLCAFPVQAAIERDLYYGTRGEDVRELQQILNTNDATRVAVSGPGSSGNETTYFGQLTEDAVRRFQALYAQSVLTPLGLSVPTGFVGRLTRAALVHDSGADFTTPPRLITNHKH
jgi:peptidoglycan hydrolase-like protein with peptidoglycan-binding domain